MKKNTPSTDGFILRRRDQNDRMSDFRRPLDNRHQAVPDKFLIDPTKKGPAGPTSADILQRPNASKIASQPLDLPKPSRDGIDLNMDLNEPKDNKANVGKLRRGLFKIFGRKKGIKKPLTRKQIIKRVLIGLGILLLLILGYFAYKFLITSGKLFEGNAITALFSEGRPLKTDENGRSNVLLFGTSEDDPGHDGQDLADSIMIASVNQEKKDVFLVSVPRDFYVDYGRACPAGYAGKINAFYACVKDQSGEKAAQEALRKKVGEVFGLDMQYSAHVNYTALREAVDAVGGITVDIASEDPRGILDRNFDWDCPNGLFSCYNVKYPNGPAHLNGKQALYLARARGANGVTYGLPQANFDREKYQRAILIALKDKAVSAGTLANPVAVNNLLDALGNNVRTNFDAEEIKTLVKLGRDIKSENIRSLVLNDPEDPLVTTGDAGGQSIVQPALGLNDYSGIQAVVNAYATGDLASIEKAKIDVLNASGTAGVAQTKADELEKEKLAINNVGDAPAAAGPKAVQLFDMSGGKKPATLKKLENVLGVKASKKLPAGVSSSADFVVILGKQPAQ